MELLIAGTVTLDTVEIGGVLHEDVPGGSALYAAAAASAFGPCRVLGAVGEDFRPDTLEALASRGIDMAGIARRPGPTFRWKARYASDLRGRETLERAPGVGNAPPPLPAPWRAAPTAVLLGSMDPAFQRSVLSDLARAALVAVDTMLHWTEDRREEVLEVVRDADVLFVGEDEARAVTGLPQTDRAGRALLAYGPQVVVLKRGARGVSLLKRDGSVVSRPADARSPVVDPTGAGDAFAGGFLSVLRTAGSIDDLALEGALDAGMRSAALAIQDLSFRALLSSPPNLGAP